MHSIQRCARNFNNDDGNIRYNRCPSFSSIQLVEKLLGSPLRNLQGAPKFCRHFLHFSNWCQDLQAEHMNMRVLVIEFLLFYYHGGGACPSPYTLVLGLSTDQG
jgi:hypothetical protein